MRNAELRVMPRYFVRRPSLRTAAVALAFLSVSAVNPRAAAGEPPVPQTPARPFYGGIVFAIVWPNGYSEVEWYGNGKTYRAQSNIDFSVFPQSLVVDTKELLFCPIIVASLVSPEEVREAQEQGLVDAKGRPRAWPKELPLSGGSAQYFVVQDLPPNAESEEALRWMDLLHQFYQNNRAQLIAEARERKRLQDELAANAAARPSPAPTSRPPVSFKRIQKVSKQAKGK